MTTNTNAAARLTVQHLLANAPFHVRASIDPIFANFNGNDVEMLRSMRNVIGPRDMNTLYTAAQHAQDTMDAA